MKIPRGLCQCGCGQKTKIATRNRWKLVGYIKGQPLAYLQGHSLMRVHGHCSGYKVTPERTAYGNAKRRCTNQKGKWYYLYGGRGIKFLFKSFEEFYEEVGPKPEPKRLYSLDRWPNNNGHYKKGNVRWATQAQQDANKRKWGTCNKRSR